MTTSAFLSSAGEESRISSVGGSFARSSALMSSVVAARVFESRYASSAPLYSGSTVSEPCWTCWYSTSRLPTLKRTPTFTPLAFSAEA